MWDEEIIKADFTIYLLLRNCNFLKYDENWFIQKTRMTTSISSEAL